MKFFTKIIVVAIMLGGVLIYKLTPAVSISDDTLGGYCSFSKGYFLYVIALNKSANKDIAALKSFLEKRNFYDGEVNTHGWVLAQLIKKNGYDMVSSLLQKIDSTHKEYLQGYIKLGIEHFDSLPLDSFIVQYPKTCSLLHIISGGHKNYF